MAYVLYVSLVLSVLSSIVIHTGGDGDGCFADCLLVCQHLMVSHFSTPPLGVRGGLRRLIKEHIGYLFIVILLGKLDMRRRY